MKLSLGIRYVGLLIGVTAPLAVVACSEDSSPGSPADAGSEAAPDTGVDTGPGNPQDAGADADADAGPILDAAPPTIECAVQPCVVDISRGNDNTCALTSTGDVYCWGDNPCGEVGEPLRAAGDPDAGDAGEVAPGPPDLNPVPAPRKVLSGARSISAGAASTCAILNSGELRCWGSPVSAFSDTTSGGHNHACTPNATPAAVEGVPHLRAVSTTISNGCGVDEDGKLHCWGSSANYLLGRAGYSSCSYWTQCGQASYPPAVADLVGVKTKDVVIYYGAAYVLDESNQLWSWGANVGLGRSSSMSIDPTPTTVPLSYVSSVSASLFGDGQSRGNNICVASQGTIYCWGGYHTPPRVVTLPEGQYAAQVSASLHSCARTIDGSLFCWGSNQAGQLGDGTGLDRFLVPVQVEGLKANAAKVVAAKATTCALLITGEVQCWGANDKGQLGIGSADFLPHLKPGSTVAFQ